MSPKPGGAFRALARTGRADLALNRVCATQSRRPAWGAGRAAATGTHRPPPIRDIEAH